MTSASGHKLEHLEGEELEKQERDWKGYTDGMVRLTPGRWLFPAAFEDYADKYYKFEVRLRRWKEENIIELRSTSTTTTENLYMFSVYFL